MFAKASPALARCIGELGAGGAQCGHRGVEIWDVGSKKWIRSLWEAVGPDAAAVTVQQLP